MFKFHAKTAFLTFAVLLLAACSNDSSDSSSSAGSADGLLQYIPADTPYLFATTGSLPDDVYEKVEPQLDATLQIYPAIIKSALLAMIEAEEPGTDVEALREALPFVDELDSLMTLEGMEEAGIDRDSMMAFYGAGILPVIRISLTDGQLMEAAIDRLEQSAKETMSVASMDNVEYRYAGDDEGRVIVSVIENQLVIAFVPSDLSEAGLKSVMGLTLPDRNIADAGTLEQINEKYGFEDFAVGFADFQQMAKIFLNEPAGINAEILSGMEFDPSMISDVCKADARSLVGIMPRVVAGYTDISVDRVTSSAIVELRSDLAAGISELTGPVPGLGDDHGGIFSMGMSANLMAAREFYSARLDAMEAEPFECPELGGLQAGVMVGREALNQPIPPIVYGFKGFLAVIEEIEGLNIQTQQPPTSIDMRLLLAMENAEGLLAMGAMFSPELAAMNIEPNGDPVKLEIGQIAAMGQTAHIAMTDDAVSLSLGDGPEARLGDMLRASPANPSPFMTFDMDAARYYSFIGDMMMADQGVDIQQEMRDSMQTMISVVQETVERMSVDIYFTDNGIEINSAVTLAD